MQCVFHKSRNFVNHICPELTLILEKCSDMCIAGGGLILWVTGYNFQAIVNIFYANFENLSHNFRKTCLQIVIIISCYHTQVARNKFQTHKNTHCQSLLYTHPYDGGSPFSWNLKYSIGKFFNYWPNDD